MLWAVFIALHEAVNNLLRQFSVYVRVGVQIVTFSTHHNLFVHICQCLSVCVWRINVFIIAEIGAGVLRRSQQCNLLFPDTSQ